MTWSTAFTTRRRIGRPFRGSTKPCLRSPSSVIPGTGGLGRLRPIYFVRSLGGHAIRLGALVFIHISIVSVAVIIIPLKSF
jgi:hypothetical protein